MRENVEQRQKRRFEEQAAWQRSRSKLPWPEKLRISARMRDDLEHFRKKKPNGPSAPPPRQK